MISINAKFNIFYIAQILNSRPFALNIWFA